MGRPPYPSEDGEALQRTVSDISAIEPDSTPKSAPAASPWWYAVYTTCRHEKRIAQHFSLREIEHFLPLYRSERKWRDGSKVTLDLPLFPGYIFVHVKKSECVSVLRVPGTVAVVGGTGGVPAPVPDSVIESLRTGLTERAVEPYPLLTIGQEVRIRSGAFAGMEGVVVRKKSGFRVVLTLELIMQSIAVEVDESDLEQIDGKAPTGGWKTGLSPQKIH